LQVLVLAPIPSSLPDDSVKPVAQARPSGQRATRSGRPQNGAGGSR